MSAVARPVSGVRRRRIARGTEPILLVEDDDAVAGVLTEFFTKDHATVVRACSGKEALEVLAKTSFALMLVDLRLPDMDGTAVMRHAHTLVAPPDTIVVTGHATLDSAIAAIEAGAVGYVLKPLDLGRLNSLVTTLLERRRLARAHARLQIEQQRRVREAEISLSIAHTLSSTLELGPLLTEVARKAAQAVGADRCWIHLFTDEQLLPVNVQFADSRPDAALAEIVKSGGSVEEIPAYARALASKSHVAVADTRASELVPAGWSAALGMQAALVMPLLRKGEVIGTLTFDRLAHPHEWDSEQIDLATTIASQIALAIDNARLFEEAQTQRTCLTQVFDSTSDGIILVNGDGQIAAVNRRAGALLAVKPTTAVGFGFLDLLAAHAPAGRGAVDTGAPFRALFADPDAGGEGDLELPLVARTVHWVAQPTRNLAGITTGLTLTFQDVTQEREVSRMKSDFVSFVTHQLRTPLAGIKWFLELAADEAAPPAETQEYIGDARQSAERLIGLVNDLLDISRLESGRLAITPTAIDLAEMTASVLGDVETLVREKGHRLAVHTSERVPPVQGDVQLLRQVVMNLVSNAIKYTRPGGDVTIRMTYANDTVTWTIKDSGIGIPKAGQARLFEKFYRAENVTSVETEGTGLGLYLVRLIVERLEGRIWCESEEGQGAAFFFTLPAAKIGSTILPEGSPRCA